MNIADIAKLGGVSIATVSRVINKKRVRKETKIRIARVIAKYKYQPDPYAQYLGRQRSGEMAGLGKHESLVARLEMKGMPRHCGECGKYSVCVKNDPVKFCDWLKKYVSFSRNSSY